MNKKQQTILLVKKFVVPVAIVTVAAAIAYAVDKRIPAAIED